MRANFSKVAVVGGLLLFAAGCGSGGGGGEETGGSGGGVSTGGHGGGGTGGSATGTGGHGTGGSGTGGSGTGGNANGGAGGHATGGSGGAAGATGATGGATGSGGVAGTSGGTGGGAAGAAGGAAGATGGTAGTGAAGSPGTGGATGGTAGSSAAGTSGSAGSSGAAGAGGAAGSAAAGASGQGGAAGGSTAGASGSAGAGGHAGAAGGAAGGAATGASGSAGASGAAGVGGAAGAGPTATLIQNIQDGTIAAGAVVAVSNVFVTAVEVSSGSNGTTLYVQEPEGVTTASRTYPQYAAVEVFVAGSEAAGLPALATISIGDCVSVPERRRSSRGRSPDGPPHRTEQECQRLFLRDVPHPAGGSVHPGHLRRWPPGTNRRRRRHGGREGRDFRGRAGHVRQRASRLNDRRTQFRVSNSSTAGSPTLLVDPFLYSFAVPATTIRTPTWPASTPRSSESAGNAPPPPATAQRRQSRFTQPGRPDCGASQLAGKLRKRGELPELGDGGGSMEARAICLPGLVAGELRRQRLQSAAVKERHAKYGCRGGEHEAFPDLVVRVELAGRFVSKARRAVGLLDAETLPLPGPPRERSPIMPKFSSSDQPTSRRATTPVLPRRSKRKG